MSRLFSRRRVIVAGGAVAVATPLAARPAAAAPLAGTLVTLITPLRVFDSRQTTSVLGGAKFEAGNSVAVAVSAAFEEGFALAVFVNITITATEGAGFLTVWGDDLSGELTPPATSNINWTASGQTLANLALSSVGGENSIDVRCGGAGRTHVIVDVQGYVPFAF
jgi:hypothetical protein